jgi:signal transduction histidine kinase
MAFVLLWSLVAGSPVLAVVPTGPRTGNITLVTNVVQLRNAANDDPGSLVAFSLQGTVVEINANAGLIVLQDESGIEMLETSLAGLALIPGQQIRLQGTNFVVPSAFGVDIERRPLVDNDGLHPEFERTGSVYLKKGHFPIQVLWFNYTRFRSLSIEYSGPNFARRKIPDSALFSAMVLPSGGVNYAGGLNYHCFEGQWQSLAALQPKVPVKTGVASNFDLSVTTRDEHVALAFDGFIQIDEDGLYTFYLGSDDGSQLFIKHVPPELTFLGAGSKLVAKEIAVRQPLSSDAGPIWAQVEGTLTFVGGHESGTEMELTSYDSHMRVVVFDPLRKPPRYLLGSSVRLRGLCPERFNNDGRRVADMLVVPNWRDFQVLGASPDYWSSVKSKKIVECASLSGDDTSDIVRIRGKFRSLGELSVLDDGGGSVPVELLNFPPAPTNTEVECMGRWTWTGTNNVLREAVWREFPRPSDDQSIGLPVITTAAHVQQLTRAEAGRGYKAKIRGVITWVSGRQNGIVVQDSTRGVSVEVPLHWNWNPPKVGEGIEIEGTCEAGEFSPLVLLNKGTATGTGVLPDPQHPTYDQLIRGSMDSQYVEIRGYVTEAWDHHLVLLMQGGKIDVEFEPDPLDALDSFVNAVVRIRGCMFAKWDAATLLVTPTHPLWFGSATICEDTPPPTDVFDAQTMQARELLQFDALANFFQRVKVCGQVLAGDQKTYYGTDGGFGFRFELASPEKLDPGDEVEVVGLVDLGGASPTLREAVIRRTGHAPLPAPQPFVFNETNLVRDATRCWMDGLLLDVKDDGTERVFEMQNGVRAFTAKLRGVDRFTGRWQAGSRLRLTGVFVDLEGREGGALANPIGLLLNSPADVVVLTQPAWWTLNRLLTMAGILTAGLALALVWISLLKYQVKRRTTQLKFEIGERQRAERARAIEQERARIAQDLHDDLGSRVTAIAMLAEAGAEKMLDPKAGKERFAMIQDRSRLLVAALDELVWEANPKYDTVAALVEYVAGSTEELLTETGIGRRIEIPARLPQQGIPAETRHNVLLSVKEVLNNAIRHGRPTEVLLQVTISGGQLEILIQDNGCGFNLARHVSGEGLANLERRLGKISGRCRIQSEPGKGTSVFLTLPL